MLVPSGEHEGWWFLNQRKRIPVLAWVPVVIMTSLSVACKEWAASLGAVGLIRKPIDVEPLSDESAVSPSARTAKHQRDSSKNQS
jgi:hypothetical protein